MKIGIKEEKEMRMDYIELSKEISYALRHAPEKYGLEMDEEGWVNIQQLIKALNKDQKWKDITKEDILLITEKAEKKRHEIAGDKIRAYYGHSIAMKIQKEEKMPPDILYHGTAKKFIKSIANKGLLPQSRQYVHLSQDTETAYNVAERHKDEVVILKIDAKRAWNSGIKFYYGNQCVWLADKIPSEYIIEVSDN